MLAIEESAGHQRILEKGLQKGLQQGIRQGIEQGLQKGLQEVLQQGLQTGQLATLKTNLPELLTLRFGLLPESGVKVIQNQTPSLPLQKALLGVFDYTQATDILTLLKNHPRK